MGVEWTPDLAVGVDEIDHQHQALFAHLDQLLTACTQNKGKQAVATIFDFLGDYVVQHFDCEEKFMLKYQYPDYAKHKEFHTRFIESFGALKTKFEAEGPTSRVVILTNHTVVDWLNSHIRKVDKLLGAFLKTKL